MRWIVLKTHHESLEARAAAWQLHNSSLFGRLTKFFIGLVCQLFGEVFVNAAEESLSNEDIEVMSAYNVYAYRTV